MLMDKTKNKKQMERIRKAKKNYVKIEKEISPFIKKRKVDMGYSTAGEWCNNSELCHR